MKIAIGSDHGGYTLKEELVKFLEELGHQVVDFGTKSAESVDYPQFGKAVAESVVGKEVDKGIVICGSGIGISIAANKVKGARCALLHDTYSAELSRRHNDANIMALGGRLIGVDMAKEIVKVFLQTEFEGGRHERRVCALD